MLRTVFARHARLALPVRAVPAQVRTYVDKFEERETAAENMYIHEKEKEQIKKLREKLAKASKQVDELEAQIAKSKTDTKAKAE